MTNDFRLLPKETDLMQKTVRPKIKNFTLLEVLLSTAVLLVIMGFLFQFVNSAQRLWVASEKTADIFDQAQLALQLLEKDLQSVLFSGEQDNPGHSIPMGGFNDNTDNKHQFYLVTQDSSAADNVGTCLVMYAWTKGESGNNELARYVWDSKIKVPELGEFEPCFFYGLDPNNENINRILDALENDTTKRNVLAAGVKDFSIEGPPGTNLSGVSSYFYTTLPKAVKITLTLYDAKAVGQLLTSGADPESDAVKQKIAETERVFSKIIFLR